MVSPNVVRSPAERSTKIPRSIFDSTSRAQALASFFVRNVSVTACQPVRRTCACHCPGPFCRMVAMTVLPTVPKLCQRDCETGQYSRFANNRFDFAGEIGAPETIRTSDLCLRRATLYPAELRAPIGLNRRNARQRQ